MNYDRTQEKIKKILRVYTDEDWRFLSVIFIITDRILCRLREYYLTF